MAKFTHEHQPDQGGHLPRPAAVATGTQAAEIGKALLAGQITTPDEMADALRNADELCFDFDAVDWVTSDQHFGHARIIELARRPFTDVDEMNAELVRRWNAAVGPSDTVLHLGDLALGRIEESLSLTTQLKGRRFLVPGNHDRMTSAEHRSSAYRGRFTAMYEQAGWTVLPEIIRGTRRGHEIVASHYPYRGDSTNIERHVKLRPVDEGLPLLHGHTHDLDRGPADAMFHVGVDGNDFAPVPMSRIDSWLVAVATN